MESLEPGALVTVTTAGPEVDGIVFGWPSDQKAMVAVVDPARGPVLRSVAAKDLAAREAEGPQDAALKALIRRTPAGTHADGPGASGVRGGAGHARATRHRTTGK